MEVFYRKYRPQRFADLVGQETISKTLLSQLESGKISHGYLFSGPKGTGKTSTARILAKAVNCERSDGKKFADPCNRCEACKSITNGSSLDVIEIDAASNRLIDDVRDLREKIKLSPANLRFKVYIIDEVHMLTREAFNALLKTLEEPPKHAIFILCTTESSKIPSTILSRVQRFNFSKATVDVTKKVIEKIAKEEKIKINDEVLDAIVKTSGGSFRDAISTLDQISGFSGELSATEVKKLVQVSDFNHIFGFCECLANKNLKRAAEVVEEIADFGAEVSIFVREAILLLEKVLFLKIGIDVVDISSDVLVDLKGLSEKFTFDDLRNLIKLLLIAESEIKIYPLAQIPVVLAVCKYCGEPALNLQPQVSNEVVEAKPETKNPREEKSVGSEKKEAPKVTTGDLARLESKWVEFLSRVKPINAHLVALLRSTRPTGFDGRVLTVQVFFRFHKEKLEEPKIMDLLISMLSNVMGVNIKLNLVLAARNAQPTKTVLASDVVDIRQDELAEIANEIFSE